MSANWNGFMDSVAIALEKFHTRWGLEAIPFFRGHSNSAWLLQPGVFRPPCDSYAEKCLYYEFRTSASMLLASGLGPWEIAFTMQHHGLPTRLLDWTEAFATALYFATKQPFVNAAVWMLDPYMLNETTFGQNEILDIEADFPLDYFEYFISDTPTPFPADVTAVLPRRSNVRLAGQHGLFTLHSSMETLDKRFSSCLQKFDLPPGGASDAACFLALAGTNEYSLFPDLDGLCRHLKGRYESLASTRSQLFSS